MGASCKGLCRLSETIKIPNSHKYEYGLKRCSWCEVWLNTDFEGGRHQKRIEKIEER